MTRTCYDAVTPANIPTTAQMVAGYVDGKYEWKAADWARFPHSVKVRIAAFSSTSDGQVLDVEAGCSTPANAPGWVIRRRAAGIDPTVYCSLSAWPTVKAAFAAAKVPEPHWWIAAYPGNGPNLYPGSVAHQYANPGPVDISVVADYWPGVDPEPTNSQDSTATVLAVAKSQLGYVETPTNITKYWAELDPALQGQPWCAGFVSWVFKHAGSPLPAMGKPYGFVYVPAAMAYAKAHGLWDESGHYAPCDIVCYGNGAHTGIIVSDDGTTMAVYEGNTSPDNSSGSQTNGGGVYLRHRPHGTWVDGVIQGSRMLATTTTPQGDAPMSATEVQTITTAIAGHEKHEADRYSDLVRREAFQTAQTAALTATVQALAAGRVDPVTLLAEVNAAVKAAMVGFEITLKTTP